MINQLLLPCHGVLSQIQIPELVSGVNSGFTMICGVLVILMQLGFAMVESGLNSHKHTANILFKNLADLSIGAVAYYLVGYRIMFPENFPDGFFSPMPNSEAVHWFYQMAFAATAATIVSGAVAGRMKFKAYLAFSAILAGLVYPFIGRICWSEQSYISDYFRDFAGSVVVHGVGGAAALAAVVVLRKRNHRFVEGRDYDRHHNLAFVLLGTMMLWVGWYGFNGGSIGDLISPDGGIQDKLSTIMISTSLGAAGGCIGGMLASSVGSGKKVDLKAAMNGCLGGLVAITASCDILPGTWALLVGMSAGIIVHIADWIFETLKMDDTVGAIAVHGVCGVCGGILAAIADPEISWIKQTGIIVACMTIVFISMWCLFRLLKWQGWLEVSSEIEDFGLDRSEHDMDAYIPVPGSIAK